MSGTAELVGLRFCWQRIKRKWFDKPAIVRAGKLAIPARDPWGLSSVEGTLLAVPEVNKQIAPTFGTLIKIQTS